MTRILLDPVELAGAASELRGTAGEYQGIGARVASCDCGCMPAHVAATVDAATAAIRSRLDGLAAEFAQEGGELAWRAGVPQDGGLAGAASAAWGGPAIDGQTVVVGGGFDTSVFGSTGSGTSVVVGGGFDTSVFGSGSGGGYNLVVGGGFDTSVFGSGSGGGYNLVIGGTDYSTTGSGGYSLVIGGTDFSTGADGGTIGPGFNLTDWGLGGTGYGNRTLGSFTPTTMNESMAVLTGMAVRNNDWFTLNTLQNITASQQRAVGIWTLPDGWRYKYSSGWGW
jgi:hypothetical protein